MTSFALRPCALDVVKHCADLRVAQHASEAWHVAFVAAADDCGGPFPDDPEKHVVGMVPRMTGFIMWRRWQPARGKRRAPIRLAFQVRAMAGGALIRIDLPPLRDYIGGCGGVECGRNIQQASINGDERSREQTARYDISKASSQSSCPRARSSHFGFTLM